MTISLNSSRKSPSCSSTHPPEWLWGQRAQADLECCWPLAHQDPPPWTPCWENPPQSLTVRWALHAFARKSPFLPAFCNPDEQDCQVWLLNEPLASSMRPLGVFLWGVCLPCVQQAARCETKKGLILYLYSRGKVTKNSQGFSGFWGGSLDLKHELNYIKQSNIFQTWCSRNFLQTLCYIIRRLSH